MNRKKTIRLNWLFEKMTANTASVEEQVELKALYKEYIYEERDCVTTTPNVYTPEKHYFTSK